MQRRVVFTHIPKTAGTSVIDMLKEAFGDAFWDSPPEPTGDEIVPDDAIVSAGHHAFRRHPMHDLNPMYVSIIRDPVDRYLSYYKHLQDWPDHYAARSVPGSAGMSPLELAKALVDVLNPEMSDLQAYMLTGAICWRDIDANIRHIEQNYALVGTVENIEDFRQRLQKLLDIPLPPMPVSNVSKTNVDYVEPGLQEFIASINPRDTAVFQHFSRKRSARRRIAARWLGATTALA